MSALDSLRVELFRDDDETYGGQTCTRVNENSTPIAVQPHIKKTRFACERSMVYMGHLIRAALDFRLFGQLILRVTSTGPNRLILIHNYLRRFQ